MKATDFDKAAGHLDEVLGIDLPKHLRFGRPATLQDFAVLGSLVVIYRYAEALGKPLIVHDMTTGGHESHHLGTELDFDLNSPRRNPLQQLHVIADLLRLRDALRSELDAFRLGFYFDYFTNTEAKTFDQFRERYGEGKTAASMHIGVRYRWSSPEYIGRPIPSDGGIFALWGRGKEGFGQGQLWTRRIRSWDVGFLKDRMESLARTVIATDFRALDNNPPPLTPVEMLHVAP